MRSSVYPSGGDLTASSAPRLLPAPGRFSTMKFPPMRSLSFAATSRPARSEPPPGANGTMMRTGFAVYDCANATIAAASSAASSFLIGNFLLDATLAEGARQVDYVLRTRQQAFHAVEFDSLRLREYD